MLQAELALPRLSLESTQEASEAPRSDDSDDRCLLPLFSLSFAAIIRIQHRRGPQPWGVKKDTSQGKDYLRCWPYCPLSFFLWAYAAGEGRGRRPWIWAGAALGRTPHRGQGRGGAQGKMIGKGWLLTIPLKGELREKT
jgi:hypothetical protein